MKKYFLCSFFAIASIANLFAQYVAPQHFQLTGGSEFNIKHRPDIADSAYQVQFRFNKVCHYCNGQGYFPSNVNNMSFTDTCGFKNQNYNINYFSGVNTLNKHAQLFVNPYTGDSVQKPIFKPCAIYPPITLNQPNQNQIIAPILDTFLLLRDFWYDTILYLPEKCGKWQVVHYYGPTNGNTHWAVLAGSGYSMSTNKDTTDVYEYAPLLGWGFDQRGVAQINNWVSNGNPYFLSQPTAVFYRNVPGVYKQHAIDPDGDSLVFSSIHLVYHDTVYGIQSQAWWHPFIPQNSTTTGNVPPWSPQYSDSIQSGLRRIPGYNCIPGMGNLPNCTRYDPVYNPFDTDTTFSINPHTGEIHFTAQSSPQFVHLLLQCEEYRNGVWVGAVYRRVNFFIFDSMYQHEPVLTVEAAGLQNVVMDSPYVFRTCPNQSISIPFHIKGTAGASYLRVWDNHTISLPASNITYQNQVSDSVHGVIQWNVTAADTGWHYILFQASDSACSLSPYINDYSYLFKIYVAGNEKLNAGKDTTICAGASIQLSATGAGNASLTWSILSGTPNSLSCTNCNNPTATPTASTTYRVQVNNMNCITADTITVHTYPDFSLQASDKILCSQTTSVELFCLVSGNVNPVTYSWAPQNAIIGNNTQASVTVNPNLATQFIVTVSDSAGCFTHQDTVNIIYDQNFNPFILASKAGICLGDTAQLQVLGIANASMAWNPPYRISNLTGNVVQVWPDSTVTYYVTVSSNVTPCTVVLNQTVQVTELRADAGPDYDIFDGEAVVLGGPGMRCNNGCKLQWYPDKWMFFNFYENPKVVPHETTKYWVVLSDEWGTCVDRDTVEVRVTCNDIYMPNVFSPESQSEQNIRYGPRNVGLEYKYFYIYNRWGEMVFASYSNRDRWDGKHNGKDQPTGVYVWVIEAKCNNGQWIKKSGNVTLIR